MNRVYYSRKDRSSIYYVPETVHPYSAEIRIGRSNVMTRQCDSFEEAKRWIDHINEPVRFKLK